MIFILILWFGFIPFDFIGPLPFFEGAAGERVYYAGPAILFGVSTPDGHDELRIITHRPARIAPPSRRVANQFEP